MTDLTDHQRSILIAMLQGKRIQMDCASLGWKDMEETKIDPLVVLRTISLRIAPNQSEAVRLYGRPVGDGTQWQFVDRKSQQSHYIDISPNGFIIGGKINV